MPDENFMVTVEVVPPAGPDAAPLLAELEPLVDLAFDAFSVATNPVAKPRMSAMALSALLQQKTGKSAILHCTTRDHNRLSLQGMLWGARALGIATVLIATGDVIALGDRAQTSSVRDLDVFDLVRMARSAGLRTGVVFDTHPESNGLEQAVRRLADKIEAGAQFAVTQPVYDEAAADHLFEATQSLDIPVILGILPLRTARHAEFLHRKVAGIAVPQAVRSRMQRAADPVAAGIANAGQMLALARRHLAGACLMPPFDHYEVLFEILKDKDRNDGL
ncbi:5,10-methylenetetrahydrofolate reductase (EC / Homolog of homocysteine-binding domain [Olavius algarvensis Delta 1 endosymbiont]|nr:5,10-methylenetetrahydrofolate reductase (EC / Homolog of homocysteine-binding domain [Olavius algarvensis Delta 1 endosymbiont]